jgi:hypothetical protein
MLTLITEVAIVQICRLTVGKDGSEVGVTINVRFTCTSALNLQLIYIGTKLSLRQKALKNF